MNGSSDNSSNPDSTTDPLAGTPALSDVASSASLQADLSVLAWLETDRQQLSGTCTDYICSALLEWSMLGHQWPAPVEPALGADCEHLDTLVAITERLTQHAVLAQPRSRRYELARVARELTLAIRSQRDPEALADSLWRELAHRQPWRAVPPAQVSLPDGRVL